MNKLTYCLSLCITICLWLLSSEAYGCSCVFQKKPLEAYVSESNFIAFVKIIRVEIISKEEQKRISGYDDMGQMAKLVYQVKEMFKGDSTMVLYEDGVNTSCDMGIREGSEWVFFGTGAKNGISSIHYCGKWIFMREGDSKQTFAYESGMEQMKELRTIMHLPNEKMRSGKKVNYFANGQKESVTHYKKNLLDGKRILYYSNGNIRETAHFKNGMRNGEEKQFSVSGQLLRHSLYTMNIQIQGKEWYDTAFASRRMYMLFEMDRLPHGPKDLDSMVLRYSMSIQLRYESTEDIVTHTYTSRSYKWNGLLDQYVVNDKMNGIYRRYEYHPNGKVSSEEYRRKEDEWTENKKWDVDGKLISHKTWSKNKYLGEQVPKDNQ